MFVVFRHALMGSDRIVRYRSIYFYTSVIRSPKNVRVFATQMPKLKAPAGNSLPEAQKSPKTPSNVATWLQIQYNRLIGSYEELSGMKEVRRAQEDVVKVQEKLQQTQEKRREIVLRLLELRNNLQTLNNDIHAMNISNPHYLELVKRRIELMQKEREADEYFELIDTNERDLFTDLTSAVRTSHEKERSQAENAKYFSMLLTMIGAVLGILGSTLSYHYRNRQYKNISEQGEKILQQQEDLRQELKRDFVDLQALLEKSIETNLQRSKAEKNQESWTQYFYRHGNKVYRFFIPKS